MSEKSERTTSNQLTLFAAGSLASLTVWPGSEEVQQMTATSGRNIAALWPSSDPASSLVRTFLDSSPPCSTRCYLTWKVKATPAGRLLCQLWPSMPRTDGIECSLWPTPVAQPDGKTPKAHMAMKAAMKDGPRRTITDLQVMAKAVNRGLWPTPRAACPGSRINSVGGKVLAQEVELAEGLRDPVTRKLWPTPMSAPTSEASHGQFSGQYRQALLEQGIDQPGQLNPTWVEWLMGFPIGWTDLEPSETP